MEYLYLVEEAGGVLGAGVSLGVVVGLVPVGGAVVVVVVVVRLLRLVHSESFGSAFSSGAATAGRGAEAHALDFHFGFLLLIVLPGSGLLQRHVVYRQPPVRTHQLPDLPQVVQVGLRP